MTHIENNMANKENFKIDYINDIFNLGVFTEYIHNDVIPISYNKLLQTLVNYENYISNYIANYKCKLINGKFNNVILIVYNDIITYSNKLFYKNKFIANISDINCVFDKIEDDKFVIDNNTQLVFINPQQAENAIIEYASSEIFKDLYIANYFRILNEFVMLLYVYYMNKDTIGKSYNIKNKKQYMYIPIHPLDASINDITKNLSTFTIHKSKQKKDRKNQLKNDDKHKLEIIDNDQDIEINLNVLEESNENSNQIISKADSIMENAQAKKMKVNTSKKYVRKQKETVHTDSD
ncbi:hypothetical protein [Alphaentomopoxvirus acuprea]|uniref:Uncharacterized protein n=1 Tax=Alphaentomopoxvirus acuprea TaxID=62099 RepID=W6JLK3_9POXV|nr:hypothetical protein BA82_gp151 [Anomala cuprea entomopoxvirus]BAO49511.1 hypothetical protein [Anomala cuprea entomopoxvirus]